MNKRFILKGNKNKSKGPKYKKFIILILIIIGIYGLCWYENNHIESTYFTYYNTKISNSIDGYKIVHLSDLHNAEFGKDNKRLISVIESMSPDVVVITGDIIDSYSTDIKVSIEFVANISKKFPVYYVTGNHEYRLSSEDRYTLFNEMQKAGAVILNNKSGIINIGNESINLIGLDDNNLGDNTLENLLDNCNQRNLSVILAHEPQYIQKYSSSNVDLVLSGHAHGGQFILPFIGAVFAPNQGFFPKYTSGDYKINNSTMYVSRGLGNSIFPLRLFNNPEVVCIELRK